MATVEIIPVQGEVPIVRGAVPIRIEVADGHTGDSTDFYTDLGTRGIVKPVAKAAARTAEQIYDEAIEMACGAAAQTAQRLDAMDEAPDEFEVTFGLSLGLGGDTKIVSASSGAQVQVRMQWNRKSSA